jgi:enolase-phosphatase E1
LIVVNMPVTTQAARVVLLDIEGTTTPIDFVYNVLFPYARQRMCEFVRAHAADPDVRAAINQLLEENARDVEQGLAPPPVEASESRRMQSVAAYALWLMDRDRKSTPLKSLQGRIWETGYESGELRSQLFADVPRAFARWRDEGRDICIYSSGSVLAQKLLFAHTEAGDLTRAIRDYFDTHVGAKREASSYRHIVASLGGEPSNILFISDVVAELDAAREAGLQTRLSVRPGNPAQPPSSHEIVHSFDEPFL